MELRMKQNRELSPDRAKLWIEPKTKQARKVQVLYYLSRNGLLEHPHFMEVTLSSNEGLYLRDVINRLNVLRGKGMPYLFSWSSKSYEHTCVVCNGPSIQCHCETMLMVLYASEYTFVKDSRLQILISPAMRSYKNGYVWHDLADNDIIWPAQGNEYVLKGSELFEGSSERYQHSSNGKAQNPKHPLEGHHSFRHQDVASSTDRSLVVHKRRMNLVEESTAETDYDSRGHCINHALPSKLLGTQNISANGKHVREDHNQVTLTSSAPAISCGSTSERVGEEAHKSHGRDSPWSPLEIGEYKVYKAESIASTVDQGADAATQTYERRRNRCTKGVSTEEEGDSEYVNGNLTDSKENQEDQNPTELSGGEVSPPPSSSASPGSPSAKIKSNTRVNILRHSHEDENFIATRSRASTVLMQLISCGSIAVKDHNFVIIPHAKSRISYEESRSRTRVISSGSVMKAIIEEELECMPENPRLANLQLEDKEYFSGSLVETKTDKEVGPEVPSLKRCASYNADRSSKSDMLERSNSMESGGTRAKCIPRKIRSLKKQPKKDVPKHSFKVLKGHINDPKRLSNGISASTQTTESDIRASLNTVAERVPQRLDLFREEQKVIKKNERQTSATGIGIESQAYCQDTKESTLPSSQPRQQLQDRMSCGTTAEAGLGLKSCGGTRTCNH